MLDYVILGERMLEGRDQPGNAERSVIYCYVKIGSSNQRIFGSGRSHLSQSSGLPTKHKPACHTDAAPRSPLRLVNAMSNSRTNDVGKAPLAKNTGLNQMRNKVWWGACGKDFAQNSQSSSSSSDSIAHVNFSRSVFEKNFSTGTSNFLENTTVRRGSM